MRRQMCAELESGWSWRRWPASASTPPSLTCAATSTRSSAFATIWPGWLHGGNVFMLRYALFRRGADIVFRDLLAADALVYAGYSAGACVLSPGLRGLELVDDADAVTRMYAAQPLHDGRPCSSTARLRARVAAQSGRGGLPSRRDWRHPSATCDMSGWFLMSGYRDLVLIKWISCGVTDRAAFGWRSEEHTSELQSL